MKKPKDEVIIGALFVDIVNFEHDISKYFKKTTYEMFEAVYKRKVEFFEMSKGFDLKFKIFIAENVSEIYGHFHPYPIEE